MEGGKIMMVRGDRVGGSWGGCAYEKATRLMMVESKA